MERLNDKWIIKLFSILAASYLLLAIIGGIRSYSPIPYWDMWDGYINFFIKVSSGDLSAWWSKHNEHRIVLVRALFWLDLTFFKGNGGFLVFVNYLLAGFSWLILSMALKEILSQKAQPFTKKIIQLILPCLLFFWIQKENFTWAFQSQCFLAQLFPLIAFYLMHKASLSKLNSNLLFSLACLTGIAALGSMGNAVLTFPLMMLLAIPLRLGWQRITILLLLAMLSLYGYFYDYTACAYHGSFKEALLHHPIGLLKYVLFYLGGPFYYVIKIKIIAQLSGMLLIGATLKMAYKILTQAKPASLQLALITFILYIGLTALGTAGGRLIFGLETATSSRYMTPALMAWSALLILYAPTIANRISTHSKYYLSLLTLIPLLLLPEQIKTCYPPINEQFENKVSGLALALNIKDEQQIKRIYPNMNHVLSIAKIAMDKNLSIFDEFPLKNIHLLIGQTELARTTVECKGHLDDYVIIADEPGYIKVSGWVFEPNSKKVPQSIAILNTENVIVGYALSGQLRPDVANSLGRQAKYSGFKGYLKADLLGQPLRLNGIQPMCQRPVAILTKNTLKVAP